MYAELSSQFLNLIENTFYLIADSQISKNLFDFSFMVFIHYLNVLL